MKYPGASAAGTVLLIFSVALLTSLATAGAVRAVTLTDEAWREIRVPDRSQRIVSLAPSITEILFAVGAGSRVAGVTQYRGSSPRRACPTCKRDLPFRTARLARALLVLFRAIDDPACLALPSLWVGTSGAASDAPLNDLE